MCKNPLGFWKREKKSQFHPLFILLRLGKKASPLVLLHLAQSLGPALAKIFPPKPPVFLPSLSTSPLFRGGGKGFLASGIQFLSLFRARFVPRGWLSSESLPFIS